MNFVTFPLSGRTLNLDKIVMAHRNKDARSIHVVQEGGHHETFRDAEFAQADFYFFAPGVKTVNEEVSIIVYDASAGALERDLGESYRNFLGGIGG
jgi:hypothetical protein